MLKIGVRSPNWVIVFNKQHASIWLVRHTIFGVKNHMGTAKSQAELAHDFRMKAPSSEHLSSGEFAEPCT